jgi:hypothetical protein
VVFLSPSRQMSGYYLKLRHGRFLLHPFQFIFHLSSYHSTLYILSYWESVVKWTTKKQSVSRPISNLAEICRTPIESVDELYYGVLHRGLSLFIVLCGLWCGRRTSPQWGTPHNLGTIAWKYKLMRPVELEFK